MSKTVYRLTGHKFADIKAGVPIMNREKICETITGDREHCIAVFRANNPDFQMETCELYSVEDEKE